MKIIKSVKQQFSADEKILDMMDTFRCMVNHCIRIGLQTNCSTLKRLSSLAYHELNQYDVLSYYKLHAISKAAGILSNAKQSAKRGFITKNPYMKRQILVSCYGFKFEDGIFKVPLGNKTYLDIPLNNHTKQILSDPEIQINSFILLPNSISISYSKQIIQMKCDKTMAIDRNLRNVTYGNCQKVIQFDLSKTVQIAENEKSILSSFKRNDVRIRKKIASKYGQRRKNRTNQLLHKVSKTIVDIASKNSEAIVFEDIRNIRKLYQKGNGQNRRYRYKLNGWSFSEIKRQIEYKANWKGVQIIQLSKKETMGTSSLCPTCGKRLQEQRASRDLWCESCQKRMDRDVVAVMNQSIRGWERLAHSKGVASEAMKSNVENVLPLILRADATKLCCQHGNRTIEPKPSRS